MKPRNGPTIPLLIAYLAFIAVGMFSGLLNVAWTFMQDTFVVSLDALGVLLTAATIGHILTSFASGRIIARTGIGSFVLGGSVLLGIGGLGYALSPTWPFLLVAAGLWGLGGGSLDSGMNTYVSARYSAGRLNWLHAAFGIGLTIGPPTVTFFVVEQGQSWRWSYLVAVGLALTVAVLILLTRRRWHIRSAAEEAESIQRPAPRIRDTLKMPLALFSLALFFVYAGGEVGVGQLTNTLFVDARGVEQGVATFWISAYWAAFTVGRLLIGVVADYFQNVLLLRFAMLGGVLGTLLLALNPGETGSPLAMMLVGLAFAPIFPVLVAETPRRVGLRHAPNAIGFQIALAGLGIAWLPGLGSWLAERTGLETIGPYLFAVAFLTLVLHELILLLESHRTVSQPG